MNCFMGVRRCGSNALFKRRFSFIRFSDERIRLPVGGEIQGRVASSDVGRSAQISSFPSIDDKSMPMISQVGCRKLGGGGLLLSICFEGSGEQ